MRVEKWGMYELKLDGPSDGNPFTDVKLNAVFKLTGTKQGETEKGLKEAETKNEIEVSGFYDGEGIYIIRFMPEETGIWEYTTFSDVASLDGISGTFECTENKCGNYGPVHIRNTYHFAYADGSAFYPFGTTCYAWIHQPENIQRQTLETLRERKFNKIRMCVFPKYYSNNNTEPPLYPFEGQAPDKWNYSRFNPEFFRHLEWAVLELQNIGIEVDLILFHPYDKGHWGFDRMDKESDLRYLKYVIARFSAFRNIWWSMANEFDYMEMKTKSDWDEYIDYVADTDVYKHLLSIHQGDVLYDHWNKNITHASIQLGTKNSEISLGFGVYKTHRDVYHKAVIYDEVGYEGNLIQRWGSLKPQELVDKFWKAVVSGTYMSHGETYQDPDDIIWWAKGGILKGESFKRIEFLKNIIEESHTTGLEPVDRWWVLNCAGNAGNYYLYYFGENAPSQWEFALPAFKTEAIPMGTKFRVDLIDTWNMEIIPDTHIYEISGQDRYHYLCKENPVVKLPGKSYMAIRIVRMTE